MALVVEDEQDQRVYAEALVRSLGYEVRLARDGHDALAFLEREPVHVIFTDLVLPDLDGLELCRAVRQRPLGEDCYLILCTGSSYATFRKNEALLAGADAFLHKPLEPEEVAAQFHVAERTVRLRLQARSRLEALGNELRLRQEAEARAREDRQRYRAVLESALDPIVVADQEGRLVEFNPAAEAFFGRARAEVLGRTLVETLVPERCRRQLEEELGRSRETGATGAPRCTLDARRADGSEVPVEVAVACTLQSGHPLFTVCLRGARAHGGGPAEAGAPPDYGKA